jgi:hypothetical protein
MSFSSTYEIAYSWFIKHNLAIATVVVIDVIMSPCITLYIVMFIHFMHWFFHPIVLKHCTYTLIIHVQSNIYVLNKMCTEKFTIKKFRVIIIICITDGIANCELMSRGPVGECMKRWKRKPPWFFTITVTYTNNIFFGFGAGN